MEEVEQERNFSLICAQCKGNIAPHTKFTFRKFNYQTPDKKTHIKDFPVHYPRCPEKEEQ